MDVPGLAPLPLRRRLAAIPWRWVLLAAIVLVVAACGTTGGGSGSPAPTPTPQGAIALKPASPGANPVDLLAWLFTPIFQAMFLGLVFMDRLVGNIAVAIILLTLALRIVLTPVFRAQTVNARRMQLVAPELKEIQRRYKGDRLKAQEATQRFYRERGISPASGCLPLLLTIGLLLPVYSVISQGLQNYDVNGMLNVFGAQLLTLDCPSAPIINETGHVTNPCINATAYGVNWGLPQTLSIAGFGLSILAVISALFQLVQSRMALPPYDPATADDPQVKIQRQMAYFLPFISIIYGGILPAGLFLYWIAGTIFTIIQQYLIIGWGGMFPLFGWTPGFARDHRPRFPVQVPAPRPITDAAGRPQPPAPKDREASAERTIRHRERGRTSRRGRRR